MMADGYYVCFVHSSVERDLRGIMARDEWHTAYRAARVLGLGSLPPSVILGLYRAHLRGLDTD